MLHRIAVTIFTVTMGLFTLVPFSPQAEALEGYRLCAMRKGTCSCQKISDGPGVMTVMKNSVCTGKPAPQKETATQALTPPPTALKIDAPAKTSSTSGFQLFNIKLPDLNPSQPARYRLCAMRKGECKCHKIGDAPGVLTNMDASRCARPEIIEEKVSNKAPVTSRKKDIKEAQMLLNRAGYDAGSADGAMGPKTRSAIKQFQSKSGLASTGVPSLSVLAALRKAPAKAKPAKTPPKPSMAQVKKRVKTAQKTQPVAPAPQPALNTSGSVKLSKCALRSGQCTCKTPDDGPRQWTVVSSAQCKRTLFVNLWDKPATPIDASPQTIKAVQKKLNLLGYDAGQADGNLGLKTTTAITSFQNSVGMPVDGKITDILLERLSDLAPDEVSKPVYAATPTPTPAAVPKPEKTAPTPAPMPVSLTPEPPLPATREETPPAAQANPLAGLLAGFNSNSGLPTSMDGYRNCARRKGTCLCQKLTDDPGVWTTMATSVCTGSSANSQSDQLLAQTDETPTVQAANIDTKPTMQPVQAKTKIEKVAAIPAPPAESSSSFLDSITKVLTPKN